MSSYEMRGAATSVSLTVSSLIVMSDDGATWTIPFGCVATTMKGSEPPIRKTPGMTKTSPRMNGRRASAFATKLSSPGPRSMRAEPA